MLQWSSPPTHCDHPSLLNVPCPEHLPLSLFSTQKLGDLFFNFLINILKIEALLIYTAMLISAVQQSDLVIFFQFFSIGYYKILNIVPCAIQ